MVYFEYQSFLCVLQGKEVFKLENTFEKLNRLIIGAFNDITKGEQKAIKEGGFDNVSVSEAHTVDAIGMYVPKTMSAVANKLDVTLGTLTVAVNHLVKKGLVVRDRSDFDKRVYMLSLTPEGKRLYKTHQKFHLELVKSLIVDLSDYEAEKFVEAFSSLNRFLNTV